MAQNRNAREIRQARINAAAAAYLLTQALGLGQSCFKGIRLSRFAETISRIAKTVGGVNIADTEFSFVVGKRDSLKLICNIASEKTFGRISISADAVRITLGSSCKYTLLKPQLEALWLLNGTNYELKQLNVGQLDATNAAIAALLLGKMPRLEETIRNDHSVDAQSLSLQIKCARANRSIYTAEHMESVAATPDWTKPDTTVPSGISLPPMSAIVNAIQTDSRSPVIAH